MCERFFTQTTRFRYLHGDLPDGFSEMELIATVVLPGADELSLQEFHSFASTHDLVWMSEGAFIATDFDYSYIINGIITDEFRARFDRTLGTYISNFTACFSDMTFTVFASSHRLATVFGDFLVGLFARSNMPDALFHSQSMQSYRRPLLPVSGEALTELVTQDTCRSLALYKFHLSVSHFHALRQATSSFKLTLDLCNVMIGPDNRPTADAVTAFVECLQGITCPLYMVWDDVNNSGLAQALPEASQLRKLTLNKPETAPPSAGSIFESLQANTALVESFQANTGLAELRVSTEFDDFDFPTLCHSLRSHTTLKLLAVYVPNRFVLCGETSRKVVPVRDLSEENKTMLLDAMHGLLKTNTVLHSVELPWCLIGTPLYEEEMVPRLEKNRFRQHFLASR